MPAARFTCILWLLMLYTVKFIYIGLNVIPPLPVSLNSICLAVLSMIMHFKHGRQNYTEHCGLEGGVLVNYYYVCLQQLCAGKAGKSLAGNTSRPATCGVGAATPCQGSPKSVASKHVSVQTCTTHTLEQTHLLVCFSMIAMFFLLQIVIDTLYRHDILRNTLSSFINGYKFR